MPGPEHPLPVDPDVPTRPRPGRPRPAGSRRSALGQLAAVVRARRDLLVVIAAGGALGSLARWSVAEAVPAGSHDLPWATATANVTGSLLLGVLMALMAEALAGTRYVRPFLGVGVLGGYTTFSTAMLETRTLMADGRLPVGLAYVAVSVLAGLVAVWLGLALGRALVAVARRRSPRRSTR